MTAISFTSNSPEETAQLAVTLSDFLNPGDVVILSGDLAAGKTHFVKSLVQAFGSTAAVSSPTYTIAHHYPSDKCPILHIDAYRLSGADEFRDLTLDDFYEQSLLAIEWGDIIDGVFSEYLKIDFNFSDKSDTARDIMISCHGDHWQDAKRDIASALNGDGI